MKETSRIRNICLNDVLEGWQRKKCRLRAVLFSLTGPQEKFLRHIFLSLLIIFITIANQSCSQSKDKEIVDRTGRAVVIKHPINRIVSTAPSNTEIIVDLGRADLLVAVDRHSANVDGVPAGLPLLDFFYPDAEVIVNLKPDIIIASGHNATGSGEDPFRLLREMGIPVVYISMSKSIEDIYMDIAFIAQLLQAQEEGEALVDFIKNQVLQIQNMEIKNKRGHPRTVYFEISAAPLMMTFGKDSFINDMISVIGALNIFENENWLVTPGAEAVIYRNPDVILTSVDYIDDPVGEIKKRPGFNHINAVINDRVYQIDNDSSSRTSARIVLALRQMSQAVYPELWGTLHE
ncbi:MAG: ABC transporter substrate-binding protein [Treponema sp.]|nr:ABC transporter substrate-binding protein [Treponema sp.]